MFNNVNEIARKYKDIRRTKLGNLMSSVKNHNISSDSWPQNGLESVSVCPVCKHKEKQLLYKNLQDWIFHCAPGRWTMYQCLNCRSGYLNPRPTEETIGLAYQTYYTHINNEDRPTGIKWIRRALGNGYRNWRFGTSFKPTSIIGALLIRIIPPMRKAIDAEMRHLPKLNNKGKLLDFGCGNGRFLELARNAGWVTQGIDVDTKAIKVAKQKGLNVVHGGLDRLAEFEGQFDAITLSHVIEHVHDPIKLLELCYQKLNSGGRLWIETPNLNAQGHSVYRKNWRGLEPPRHLVLFDTESLRKLLIDIGFTKVLIEDENPVIDMMFDASEAILNDKIPHRSANNVMKNIQTKYNRSRFKKIAKKNVFVREFITLSVIK